MSAAPAEALAVTYGAIAEWLLYPEEIEQEAMDAAAAEEAVEAARQVDLRAAQHLQSFWQQRDSVDPEAYLELLELNPRCPLYLGSYQFPEPATCSAAGVSDRNQYMLEIANVYRHFGFEISGELPDYLPAMTEFLALSSGSADANAKLRRRFIERLMLAGTRTFAERLEEAESIYARLAQALVLCLEREAGEGEGEPEPDSDEGGLEPVVRSERTQAVRERAKVVTID